MPSATISVKTRVFHFPTADYLQAIVYKRTINLTTIATPTEAVDYELRFTNRREGRGFRLIGHLEAVR
jgi:hypothetical protein